MARRRRRLGEGVKGPFPLPRGGGEMKKRMLAIGMLLSALLLAGCLQVPTTTGTGSPELAVKFGDSRTTVIFEVKGARALKYVWNFGDGETGETTIPKATHYYAAPGVYLVTVEGIGKGATGDGGPGPGVGSAESVVFQIEVVVDTRPAIEIIGMKITPVDPPNWYAPGTPAWPEWHYPANVPLRFQLLVEIHRQGEIEIKDAQWIITDSYGRIKKTANAQEWIWYEAMTDFFVYGCPGGATEYRVYLTVVFTDGSEWKTSQSIWACPSGGCR